jgi:hypothetical protein
MTTGRSSKELKMLLLHEGLARERMLDHERSLEAEQRRRMLSRLAQARRLQRRAESASRRARALMLSL